MVINSGLLPISKQMNSVVQAYHSSLKITATITAKFVEASVGSTVGNSIYLQITNAVQSFLNSLTFLCKQANLL